MVFGQSYIDNGPTLGWLPGSAQQSTIGAVFANLPPGVEGMIAHIVDSPINTWGVGVTSGGGTFDVALYFNGHVWSVFAK